MAGVLEATETRRDPTMEGLGSPEEEEEGPEGVMPTPAAVLMRVPTSLVAGLEVEEAGDQ